MEAQISIWRQILKITVTFSQSHFVLHSDNNGSYEQVIAKMHLQEDEDLCLFFSKDKHTHTHTSTTSVDLLVSNSR